MKGTIVRIRFPLPKWAAFLVAVAPWWLLFLLSDRRGPSMVSRWNLGRWAQAAADVLLPFGKLVELGYDWTPSRFEPLMWTILLFAPIVVHASYRVLSGDWSKGAGMWVGAVGSAWIVMSVAFVANWGGLLSPLWHSGNGPTWREVLYYTGGRLTFYVLPYTVGWVLFGSNMIVTVLGAKLRERQMKRDSDPQ